MALEQLESESGLYVCGDLNIIVGLQRGDEGKGKFTDDLADEHDVVVRFNGGNNAGHKIKLPDGKKFTLSSLPSAITHEDVLNVIGNGVLVNAESLLEEIGVMHSAGYKISEDNLLISSAANLILPHHVWADILRESSDKAQDTTKKGISEAMSDKVKREGVQAWHINNDPQALRKHIKDKLIEQRSRREAAGFQAIDESEVADRYIESALQLGVMVTDTVYKLNNMIKVKKPGVPKNILAEGAQAFQLDPDHGMYPETTSTNTVAAAACVGSGIPTKFIKKTYGVAKAVPSHVGGGPFPTEIHDQDLLEQLHGDMEAEDAEKGSVSGRKRRLGYFDLAGLRRAIMVNGPDELLITKLDWVCRYGSSILMCVEHERKGKPLSVAPDLAPKLRQTTPVWEELQGWSDDVSGVTEFRRLPQAAQNFIHFIEDQTETPITRIGVGPRRDQTIIRDA